jgi:hypothetical protein
MNRFVLAMAAVVVMLPGFTYAQYPAHISRTDGQSSDTMAECPLGLPGTQVSTANTPTGEALTFWTATPAQVEELRLRVRAAADGYNENHGSGTRDMRDDVMMGGRTPSDHMMATAMGGDHVKGVTMMPRSRATVTDVDKGACITLTPHVATDLEELQSAIRDREERMQRQSCGPVARQ